MRIIVELEVALPEEMGKQLVLNVEEVTAVEDRNVILSGVPSAGLLNRLNAAVDALRDAVNVGEGYFIRPTDGRAGYWDIEDSEKNLQLRLHLNTINAIHTEANS
jgi:hypothetical protein